jgi:competence protein ComEC
MAKPLYLFVGILFLLLVFRLGYFYQNRSIYNNNDEITLTTTLLSEPQLSGRVKRFSVLSPDGQRFFITTQPQTAFSFADTVTIHGTVKKTVLENERVILSLSFPTIKATNTKNSFIPVVAPLRRHIITFFNDNLPNEESSLLLGIVFGIKQGIDSDFSDKLQTAGLFHVVAASGMNITFLAVFVTEFFLLFTKRQLALGICCITICFYAVLSGLEASILRASCMGILAAFSQITGRQTLPWYSLVLTAFIMLFIWPYLLGDVGFQLSFLATIGVLYIRPLLEIKNKKNLFLKILHESEIITTLSAQIMTVPVLLSTFGMYSVWSLLSNGLVLFLIPYLMVLGFLAVVISFISPFFASFVLFLTLPLFWYFKHTVAFFGGFSGVKLENISVPFIICYYLILVALLWIVKLAKRKI